MSFHANYHSKEVDPPSTVAGTPAGTDLACAYHCNSVMILPWADPFTDIHGYDPRSGYAETFWLGTLGPTVTWLIRFTAYVLDRYPQGVAVDPDEICLRIGIGRGTGPNSALVKALRRCIRFELARLPLPATPLSDHPPTDRAPGNAKTSGNAHTPRDTGAPGCVSEYTDEHASNRTLTLEIRRKLPLLPVRYLDRLPDRMRQLHARYLHDLITA
jgi:hypothetical protein